MSSADFTGHREAGTLLDLFAKDLFKGRTVFVTGGGSGINLGIARCFASLGARVAICGRTRVKLEAAAEELMALGAQVHIAVADVRDYEKLEAALVEAGDRLGPIDVLVCGAAGNFLSKAEELSPARFRAVIDIDLVGTFQATKAAFPQLRRTRGCAIFVSSGQSTVPYALQAHAGAAKAGVDNLMRNLALEWGRYGIRVNSIVPGPIKDTEGMRRLAPGDAAETVARTIPLGRFGTTEEIGVGAVFLASPLARYMTGAVLTIDGGQNLPGSGLFSRIVEDTLSRHEAGHFDTTSGRPR
jgi:NAD(P)-dependent dehydrogenase (short-subunit alcohol dehydrogenase family)